MLDEAGALDWLRAHRSWQPSLAVAGTGIASASARLATRRLVSFSSRSRGGLFQNFHLTIDAKHLGHLFRKVRIALFQVVSHFVRFHLFLVQDLANGALRQVGEAGISLRRSTLSRVASEKPRRPQFVRIAEVLRLPACQRYQPGFGFEGDRRFSARLPARKVSAYMFSRKGNLVMTS